MNHKILGIDTSSKVLGLALACGDEVLLEMNCTHAFRHVETLFVLLQEGLRTLKWTMHDIDIIACGLGPGSFTGLRVGLAAVKGFGSIGKKKVLGISSLDIIARNICFDTECYVVVDARREKIYTAHYTLHGGLCNKKSKDRLVSYKELCTRIKQKRTKNTITLCGDALRSYGDRLKKDCGKNILFLPEDMWYPRGKHIIHCAHNEIARGQFISIPEVLPRYLFISPAEEKRKRKKK